eukprot:jgi/Pico_ML_1/51104/g2190.t1
MIREVVDQYQYVAMDTEFPGVVARPVHSTKVNEYQYQTLRCNVDMLKLIQLGLTFCDEDGNLPSFDGKYMVIWQFNFREFDVENDMYAEDSIELLKESGIDFDELMQRGIEVHRFGELLMTSGVVLNDEIRWLTFHWFPSVLPYKCIKLRVEFQLVLGQAITSSKGPVSVSRCPHLVNLPRG